MESLGEKLRARREEKGLDIEAVADATKIAEKFIEALENENYDIFDGEVYLIGFIRNYSEFLELNSDEMVTVYKNYKIQAEPTPVESLLVNKKKISPKLIIAIAISLVILAILVVSIFAISSEVSKNRAVVEKSVDKVDILQSSVFIMNEDEIIDSFEENNAVSLSLGKSEPIVYLTSISKDFVKFKVILDSSDEPTYFEVKEKEVFNFSVDGEEVSLAIEVLTISDSKDKAQVRFSKIIECSDNSVSEASSRFKGVKDSPIEQLDFDNLKYFIVGNDRYNIGESTDKSRIVNPVVILSATKKSDIILESVFKNRCFFRYSKDKMDMVEKVFQSEEKLRVSANDMLFLSTVDSGAIVSKINGKEFRFGNDGSIVSKLIFWNYNNKNKNYDLISQTIY